MNLNELARQLGLSTSTVSRVLSGKGDGHRIGQATQERIRVAAQRHGVTINHQARALRLRSTGTLGLVVPDISNPFFAGLSREVELAARARGFAVLLADSREDAGVEEDLCRVMRGRGVDGLIVAPVDGRGGHLGQLAEAVRALVLVDRVAPGIPAPAVVLDNAGASAAAVRLLVAAGHRSIGCVQGLPASAANEARVTGFREAMAAAGLPASQEAIAGDDYTVESGRAAARRLLGRTHRPTAILALGNLLALGVLEAAREAGLAVPGELSLISFDEQPWAAALAPPLTTIVQPLASMGREAMRLLFARLDGDETAGEAARVVLPFEIRVRASVAAPAA
jgi:LacI family transcriptional regulator